MSEPHSSAPASTEPQAPPKARSFWAWDWRDFSRFFFWGGLLLLLTAIGFGTTAHQAHASGYGPLAGGLAVAGGLCFVAVALLQRQRAD